MQRYSIFCHAANREHAGVRFLKGTDNIVYDIMENGLKVTGRRLHSTATEIRAKNGASMVDAVSRYVYDIPSTYFKYVDKKRCMSHSFLEKDVSVVILAIPYTGQTSTPSLPTQRYCNDFRKTPYDYVYEILRPLCPQGLNYAWSTPPEHIFGVITKNDKGLEQFTRNKNHHALLPENLREKMDEQFRLTLEEVRKMDPSLFALVTKDTAKRINDPNEFTDIDAKQLDIIAKNLEQLVRVPNTVTFFNPLVKEPDNKYIARIQQSAQNAWPEQDRKL